MYVVTNHLFPKPEFFDRLVGGFAADHGAPITEKWDATRFELRRPEQGNEWLSASIWASHDAFDAWRGSQDIRTSHANINYEMYSQRALLSFHDVVMNSAPGRVPVSGSPERYPRLGIGTFIAMHRFTPEPEHADDVVQAFAALPVPATTGWTWWDLWKNAREGDWWSICYFTDRAAYEAAQDMPYLTLPGSAEWYADAGSVTLHEVELERIPGMTSMGKRETVGV